MLVLQSSGNTIFHYTQQLLWFLLLWLHPIVTLCNGLQPIKVMKFHVHMAIDIGLLFVHNKEGYGNQAYKNLMIMAMTFTFTKVQCNNKLCDVKLKVWLGGPTKNHLEEWLKKQNWPNNIPKPFLLNVFIITIAFYHVYPLHAKIYGFRFCIGIKKSENYYEFVLLIIVILSWIMLLDFENS